MESSIKRSNPFFSHNVWRSLIQSLNVASLVLIALIGSGCGTATVNFDIDASKLNANSLVTPQMPLSIGVYYPPTTRNYHHRFTYGHDYDIHVGDMSVRLWNTVFSQTFNKVVLLEQHPLDFPLDDPRLDIVMEVRIDSFKRSWGKRCGTSCGGRYIKLASAEIGTTFVLRCPNGGRVAEWHVLGVGKLEPRYIQYRGTQLRIVIESAFVDAEQQFQLLMSSLPSQLKGIECSD